MDNPCYALGFLFLVCATIVFVLLVMVLLRVDEVYRLLRPEKRDGSDDDISR